MIRKTAGLALLLSLPGCAVPAAVTTGSAEAPVAARCTLSKTDVAANSKLSFADFDQLGSTEATARRLGERKCYAEAARATEHYLVHGPILDDYQRNVVRWHLGQYLASAGDERAAAHIMASTRRVPDPARPDFDWNSYVTGTWAFLVKDRALLAKSAATLAAAPDRENGMNARILRRLTTCFDRSYREAYEAEACAPADP